MFTGYLKKDNSADLIPCLVDINSVRGGKMKMENMFNKTHCDRCGLKINKGEGIYADGGFYHKDICYEKVKQEYIDNYDWDEYKTYAEPIEIESNLNE